MNHYKTICIIPARGNSKGIPGKNMKDFLGRPLIYWTIEIAKESGIFDRVLLSTDDLKIAEIGLRFGAEVPFLRPSLLACDTASTDAVIRHALEYLKEHEKYECKWVMVLEPTSPSRRIIHIKESHYMLVHSGADTIASISKVPHHFLPEKLLSLGIDGEISGMNGTHPNQMKHRRQDLIACWAFNGLIFGCKTKCLLKPPHKLWGEKVIGYKINERYCIDLDLPSDWKPAEARFRNILDEDTK